MEKPISLMVELEALVAKAQAGDKQVRVPQSQTEMHEITILRGFWLSQLCGCGGLRGRIVRCVLAPPGWVRMGESAGPRYSCSAFSLSAMLFVRMRRISDFPQFDKSSGRGHGRRAAARQLTLRVQIALALARTTLHHLSSSLGCRQSSHCSRAWCS